MTSLVGTVNVRVTKQTHRQLGSLAKENGVSMQTMIDKAVDTYRRQAFLEGLNSDFAARHDVTNEKFSLTRLAARMWLHA